LLIGCEKESESKAGHPNDLIKPLAESRMPELIPFIGQIEEVFLARPFSNGAMITVFVAITLFAIYSYRRPWGIALPVRLSLITARILALVLVVTTLLEPTAVVKESYVQARRLPVLIDISESMSIKDQRKSSGDIITAATALGMVSPKPELDADRMAMKLNTKQRLTIASSSRLDLGKAALTKSARPVFESLSETLDLSFYAFGSTTRMISEGKSFKTSDINKLNHNETETSIAAALESVVNSGGIPSAGIVLISDGIDNSASQNYGTILRDLASRNIPVFTIPIGLPNPDDISLRNLIMQEVAYSGDKVPVRIQFQSKGYEKRNARLSVHLNDRRVSSRVIKIKGGIQFEEIDFNVDVYEKGAARIEVIIEPFDNEVSTENNRMARSIRVVNEKVNVLYLEGNARWEYRYLRAILKRDPRINATFIATNVGPEVARNSTEHIERFPNERQDAYQYDLVILGDVDASFFSDEELGVLEELIRDRGASLIMLCGPMHSPGSYAGTPVETMLPVRFEDDAEWVPITETVYPVLTPEGMTSQVMTLENDAEVNDRVWSRMAPMDQLPPLLSVKPGATLLAMLSDNTDRDQAYPLVAWQRYGTGKCMSIASDRLWRLRYRAGDKYHWRVWSQCIQFMTLSRLMGEHKRVRLETDRSVYTVDDQCRLYAHVLDDEYEPTLQPSFDVYLSNMEVGQERQRITLRPDKSQSGLYEGYFTPPKTGRYRVEPSEEDRTTSNSTEFQVTKFSKELIETNARPEHLKRISKLTGGKSLTISELPSLTSLLKDRTVTTTTRSERPLWDNGLIALLLVLLLGSEWIFRRRYDLP
jgi:hypothetical protein